MAYGTGGLAFAQMTIKDRTNFVSASQNMTGWVAGVGVEYAWNKYLTARLEYLHSDFGSYRLN